MFLDKLKFAIKKDLFHQPDVSAEELRLVAERLKIRKALRTEYLRKATDPHSMDPIVFDPMVQRYYSLQMTAFERFIPTFKNWCRYMCTSLVPIVIFYFILKYDKDDFERKCRSGELEYKDRKYRHI